MICVALCPGKCWRSSRPARHARRESAAMSATLSISSRQLVLMVHFSMTQSLHLSEKHASMRGIETSAAAGCLQDRSRRTAACSARRSATTSRALWAGCVWRTEYCCTRRRCPSSTHETGIRTRVATDLAVAKVGAHVRAVAVEDVHLCILAEVGDQASAESVDGVRLADSCNRRRAQGNAIRARSGPRWEMPRSLCVSAMGTASARLMLARRVACGIVFLDDSEHDAFAELF